MRFGVLGPLEVRDEAGELLEFGAARERVLLLRLLVDRGRVISVDELIEALWQSEPPRTAVQTVRAYVHRVRGALGGGTALSTHGRGYLLDLAAGQSDADRFSLLLGRARDAAIDPSAAGALVNEALGLWRGGAFEEVSDRDWARPDVTRLEEARLGALEWRIELDLAAGRHLEVIGEIEGLCARERYRERLWAARILALHRCGRTVDALAAFHQLRSQLIGELGIEPSRELRDLHNRILADDPTLELNAVAVGETPRPPTASRPWAAVAETRRPTNLPRPRSTFVAPPELLDEVMDALSASAGPLTLTGSPGVGKTRLAVETATRVDGYPDGVWFVDLAPISDGSLVAGRVAATLGVGESQQSPMDTLVSRLSPQRMLLVLDNCEQVRGEVAVLSDRLLAGCAGLDLLITSRVPLGVDGEVVMGVPPLAVPAPELPDPSSARGVAACQLLIDRALGVGVWIQPDDHGAMAAVAEICRRLDGVPLALELVGARAAVLSMPEILERLDDALGLLSVRSVRVPERHQTLRTLIGASYEQLDVGAQALLRRLSVFSGTAPLSGVEAVCVAGVVRDGDCIDLLQTLVERSLVVADTTGQETRYRLLETIRQYAREQLEAADELETFAAAHARWVIDLCIAANERRLAGEQVEAMEVLTREHTNAIAALDWLVDRGAAEDATRLAAQMGQWWYITSRIAEGRRALARVLALPAQPSRERAVAFRYAGALARANHEFAVARGHILDGIEIARHVGDPEAMLQLRITLGALSWNEGDSGAAVTIFEQALEIAYDLGDLQGAGSVSYNLGVIARDHGELDLAAERLDVALEMWVEAGDPRVALALGTLATVAMLRGDWRRAEQGVVEALTLLRDSVDLMAILELLETVVLIDVHYARYPRAAVLLGHTTATRELNRMARTRADREALDEARGTLDTQLGRDLDRHISAGETFTPTGAIDLALGGSLPGDLSTSGGAIAPQSARNRPLTP